MTLSDSNALVLASDCTFTLERAIRTAASCFEKENLCFGHGTNTAVDEAAWLILFSLGLSPTQPPDYGLELNAEQVAVCNRILKRRISERMPAAYLTGQTWFAGHRFFSDQRALVPRSPLAEFINDDFFGILQNFETPRVLDLCTGGGCIAVACAYALPNSRVDASDLSRQALDLARQNVEMHGLQDRVKLLQGSLFEPIDDTYDLIISNPPYVDAVDLESMPAEFHHEPSMGLEAGADGLDLVRTILGQAADYLSVDGYLVVEVGNSQYALERNFDEIDFSWLEFANGGGGVFLVPRTELLKVAGHKLL
jgi:ribosomal protein L3 glutamine methyltransferase